MSNTKRGRISFEADGAGHELALTTNAMCRYQDKGGETLVDGMEALQKSPNDVVRLRRIFWAALQGEYSEDDAGELIDTLTFSKAFELLTDAVALAFPSQDTAAGKSKTAKTQAAKPSTPAA